MSNAEGKSKRDLIWEQKKRAREQALQNGNNPLADPNSNPAPEFMKKSPLYDNFEQDNSQQSKPLDNVDANRGRRVQFQNEENKPISQPSNNQPYQVRDYAQEEPNRELPQDLSQRNNLNQPNYSDYEPVVNRNKPQERFPDEGFKGGQKVNFNPTFQPSVEHHEPLVGRESRELAGGRPDEKKRKYDYAEELRNQMRQNEIKKKQEKNDIRASHQGDNNEEAYMREADKNRKLQYGDYLKQQMQAKQDAKKFEKDVDRKNQLIQSMEQQEYNPFGRGGAGAPLNNQYGGGQRNQLINPNFPDQRQQNYGQPQQQAGYIPQGREQRQQQPIMYPPQQQQYMDPYPQNNNAYNNNNYPGQQNEQVPPTKERFLPRQGSYDMRRGENFTPGNQLQRAGTMDYGSYGNVDGGGSMENIDANGGGNNYQRGNTLEGNNERVGGGRRGLPLQSEDPQSLAKKERMKQDFQKGLQEQVEYKKKMKELEKQRKWEEDRLEEERLKREQEELDRRQAEEDPKKKRGARSQVEQADPNNFVQQPKERPNRNRAKGPENPEQFNSNPGPNQPNDILNQQQQGQGQGQGQQQRQPPYYNQPPPQQYQYPPQYNQPYNPMYPPPFNNHQYPPPYNAYPGPYGQPYPQTPPFANQQFPASYPSGHKPEVVNSEIHQIRAEMQNQQAVLSKQLELIKKEAQNVMKGRDEAERELMNLREQLKDKMMREQVEKQNLQNALEKNMYTRPHQRVQDIPIKPTYQETKPLSYDPYPVQQQQEKAITKRQVSSRGQGEREREYNIDFHHAPNIDQAAYEVRRTDQNLLKPQHDKFEESYSPYLDHDRTLAGDTKMIPLDVFDNRGSTNLRASNNDPLTLTKIHKYDPSSMLPPSRGGGGGRPSSSKQWNPRDEDSIDALLKGHGGGLRPSSSESNPFGDTTHLIGKRLEDTSAILKGGSYGNNSNRDKMPPIPDRYGLKSREKDTLGMAGRNVLGEKSTNMNMKGGYGQRGDEGIRLNMTGNTDLLPDLSMGHGMDPHDLTGVTGHHGMDMTGNSFNIDKINLANEARLKKLENMGMGSLRSNQSYENTYGTGGGGKAANYYRGGGGNAGGGNKGLASIQEDPNDNLAKVDNLLGGYLKTYENEEQNRKSMY